MTACAVFNIPNTLFRMDCRNLRRLVGMATIASVTFIYIARVAGSAGDVMRTVKLKIAFMGKSGWLPTARLVTLSASVDNGSVKRARWFGVARGAEACNGGLEKAVIKCLGMPRCQ
jgi:hypothetical protein